MFALVYSVNRVVVSSTMTTDQSAPAITIEAVGQVPSSGWSKPELGPWTYIVQPTDGILDIDLIADAPSSQTIIPPLFPEIDARLLLAVPEWVRGVRVHSASNELEAMIGAGPSASEGRASIMGDGMPLPWPFPWFVPPNVSSSA